MAVAMVVEIVLSSGVITPDQLPELIQAVEAHVPAGGTEGVMMSGRLPVWAFAALAHLFHPRPWVATFDPRLGGGVVVQTHVSGVNVGQVIPLDAVQRTVQVTF